MRHVSFSHPFPLIEADTTSHQQQHGKMTMIKQSGSRASSIHDLSYSTTSSPNGGDKNLLLGDDGELHDPGYSQSLATLHRQIVDQGSTFDKGIGSSSYRSTTFGHRHRHPRKRSDGIYPQAVDDEPTEALDSSEEEQRSDLNRRPSSRTATNWQSSSPRSTSAELYPMTFGEDSTDLKRGSSSFRRKGSRTASTTKLPLDDWNTSFRGIVDLQREEAEARSRRSSVETLVSSNCGSGGPSPALRPTMTHWSGEDTTSTALPANALRRGSTKISSKAGGSGSKRRSSEPTTRLGFFGTRMLSTNKTAAETVLRTLDLPVSRTRRSESEPHLLLKGSRTTSPESSSSDSVSMVPLSQQESNSSSTTVSPPAPRRSDSRGRKFFGLSRPSNEAEKSVGSTSGSSLPLTPLDEHQAYHAVELAPPSRSPYRSSYDAEGMYLPLQSPSSQQVPLSNSRPHAFIDLPASSAISSSLKSNDSQPLVQAMRRKMQGLNLAVKMKVVQAENRWRRSEA